MTCQMHQWGIVRPFFLFSLSTYYRGTQRLTIKITCWTFLPIQRKLLGPRYLHDIRDLPVSLFGPTNLPQQKV